MADRRWLDRTGGWPPYCSRARVFAALIVLATLLPAASPAADALRIEELSLEELLEVKVSTVYGASLYKQTTGDAPSSITIITFDEIRRYGWRTIAEILAAVRSFYVSDDRVYSYLGVRGLQRPGDYNSRVLVLLDGHSTNENLYGGASFGHDAIIDVALLDRIEIIRGPGSSLYGTGAFFGVVNLITRTGKEIAALEVQADAGSLNTRSGRASFGRSFANGVDLVLSGSAYRSDGEERFSLAAFDDPATNNGIAENADGEEADFLFLRLSRGGLTLEGALTDRDRTSPSAPYGTVFNTDRTWSDDTRGFLELRYEGKPARNTDLAARVFYDEYRYLGNYLYDYASEGEEPLLTDNRDKGYGRWFGAESHAVASVGDQKITGGAEFMWHLRQDQTNYDVDPYWLYLDDTRDSLNWGVFLQDELRLGRAVILTLGARYDHYEAFGGTVNPRAALVWTPRETTSVKLLYGTAFRAPNVFERYYVAGGFYNQNPELEPERIATYEAVVEQKLGTSWRVTAGAFHYQIRDMISLVEDPADGMFLFDNTGGLKATGAEFELGGKWAGGFQAVASYSYQEVREDESDEIVVNSSRHMAKARGLAPLLPGKIFLGAEAQYVGGRKTTTGGEVDKYTVVNATLSTAPGLLGPVELTLSAYNVFDASYDDPTADDFVADRVPRPGRTLRATATVRF